MVKLKTKRQPREMLLAFVAVGSMSFLYFKKFYLVKSIQAVEQAARATDLKKDIASNEPVLADLQVRVGSMAKTSDNAPAEKPTRFLSELLGEINSKESGVRVNSFITKENRVDANISSIGVDLTLESTFLDLSTLIERLEGKYKFLEFKKLETQKVDDFLQKCKSNVSLMIYLDKGKT